MWGENGTKNGDFGSWDEYGRKFVCRKVEKLEKAPAWKLDPVSIIVSVEGKHHGRRFWLFPRAKKNARQPTMREAKTAHEPSASSREEGCGQADFEPSPRFVEHQNGPKTSVFSLIEAHEEEKQMSPCMSTEGLETICMESETVTKASGRSTPSICSSFKLQQFEKICELTAEEVRMNQALNFFNSNNSESGNSAKGSDENKNLSGITKECTAAKKPAVKPIPKQPMPKLSLSPRFTGKASKAEDAMGYNKIKDVTATRPQQEEDQQQTLHRPSRGICRKQIMENPQTSFLSPVPDRQNAENVGKRMVKQVPDRMKNKKSIQLMQKPQAAFGSTIPRQQSKASIGASRSPLFQSRTTWRDAGQLPTQAEKQLTPRTPKKSSFLRRRCTRFGFIGLVVHVVSISKPGYTSQ